MSGLSWKDLGAKIARRSIGLQDADREDVRQDLLLRNVELHRAEGLEPYPAYAYALPLVHFRARERRCYVRGLRELEWDSWYQPDLEAALDLIRAIDSEAAKKQREPKRIDPKHDLTGKSFGDYRVIGVGGRDRHGRRMWRILCLRCDEKREAIGAHLKGGSVKWCHRNRGERMRAFQPKGVAAAAAKRKVAPT